MAQTLVSVDVSSRKVRIAVVEATLKVAALKRVETIERDPEESLVDVLSRARSALPDQIDSVVTHADPGGSSLRRLEFPFGDVRKVEAALTFELENQVPYDLEDVATAWSVTERTSNSAAVLSAIAPYAGIRQRIDDFGAADLEPRAIVPPAPALAPLTSGLQANEPVSVVALGEQVSHLVAVNGDTLVAARSIRAGGRDVDRALMKHFGLDLEQAARAKEEEARLVLDGNDAADAAAATQDPADAKAPADTQAKADAEAAEETQTTAEEAAEPRRISRAVEEGLAPLVTHLSATFRTLPEESLPTKLYLTGGLAQLPGLADYLSRVLGMEVAVLELSEAVAPLAIDAEAVGPEHALVVGLALTSLRRSRAMALNFRRGQLAYGGDIQLYRGQLLKVVSGVMAVILLAIVGAVVRYSMISAEEEQLNRGFCRATKRIVGREICDPTAALATMRQSPGRSDGVVIPEYSTATVFEMLSKAITQKVDVTLEDLEVRLNYNSDEMDRIQAKGEAGSFRTTEKVVTLLRKQPCVKDAEVSKQKKSSSGRVEFDLEAKLRCPGGVIPGGAEQVANAR